MADFYIASTSKDNLNKFNEDNLGAQAGDETAFRVENGLWLALNGMPTGICIDEFSHASKLPFSIVVDVKDQSVRNELDAGRKGISEYRVRQIRDKANELLRAQKFIQYRKYVVGADTRIGNPLYDPKKALLSKLGEKKLYNIPLFQRFLPPLEEQAVITLFSELLARGLIRGYVQKVLSGYEVYDGLYDYKLSPSEEMLLSVSCPYGVQQEVFDSAGGMLEKENLLVEFKTDFKALYKDIDQNKKDIGHIDILVCWSTGPEGQEYYQTTHGDLLQRKSDATNVYYGVTHELVTGKRQQPLPIIELRTILVGLLDYESHEAEEE